MTTNTKISHIFFIFTILTIVYSYSIDGPWKLQIDSSYRNISSDASIVFDFKKTIKDNKIEYGLNIFACSLIEFKYVLNNSQISFELIKIGINRRQCVKDQVSQLIKRVQKIVYTSTINNVLLFLTPSGKTIFKLIKSDTTKILKNLADVWEIVKLNGQQVSTIIKANSTALQFCGGNASVQYKILRPNVIDMSIKKSKGCSQNQLLTSIYRTHYLRSRDDSLYFYNDNVELLMKWNNLGDYGENQPIVFQENVVKKIMLPENNKISSQVDPIKLDNLNVINTSNSPSVLSVNLQNMPSFPAPVPTRSIRNQDSLQPSPPPIKTQAPINPANIQFNPVMSALPPTFSLPPPSPSPSYLTAIRQQDILTKWYLVGSQQQTMMIISSNRLVVYGGCGVLFSIINLSEADLGKVNIHNIQPKNSLNQCLGKNNRVQYLLTNVHHVTIREQAQKYLQFWDKYNNIIGEWSNTKQK